MYAGSRVLVVGGILASEKWLHTIRISLIWIGIWFAHRVYYCWVDANSSVLVAMATQSLYEYTYEDVWRRAK